jgi:hypothetical protein
MQTYVALPIVIGLLLVAVAVRYVPARGRLPLRLVSVGFLLFAAVVADRAWLRVGYAVLALIVAVSVALQQQKRRRS